MPVTSPSSFYALSTVLATAAYLATEIRDWRLVSWIAKPLAATGFVATALAAGALESSYGRCMLAGLLFSWVGDVALLSRGSSTGFRVGLVAFILGHVAYAVAFVVRGVSPLACVLAAVVLAVPASLAIRWLDPYLPPALRWPVRAYVTVITTMVVFAVGTVAASGGAAILIGALMFYVSDLAVARDRFVEKTIWNRTWGTPLYFVGQVVLALTVR